jgi:hypothetical protein
MLFCSIINMNQNYNKIPCFVEKNPNTIIKICGISKQSSWFFIASTFSSSFSYFPNFMYKNLHVFPNFPLLNHPKSHHHDQNQQEFKIQN